MDTSVLSAVLFLLFPGQGSLSTCVSYISSSREGEIVSPNYPLSYDNGRYCIWEIYLSTGGVLVIHFNEFDLYLAGNCYDYLTIYDGLKGDRLVDEACGDSLYNKTLVSKTRKLLSYFTSSSYNNAKGFKITWKVGDGDIQSAAQEYYTYREMSIQCMLLKGNDLDLCSALTTMKQWGLFKCQTV